MDELMESNHMTISLSQLRELALNDDCVRQDEGDDLLSRTTLENQEARLVEAREACKAALRPYFDVEALEHSFLWDAIRDLLNVWTEVYTEVGMIAGARMAVRLMGATSMLLPGLPDSAGSIHPPKLAYCKDQRVALEYASQLARFARRARGLSQAEMAKRCHRTLKEYRSFERADASTAFDIILMMNAAEALDLPVHCILCEQGKTLWEQYKAARGRPMTRRCKCIYGHSPVIFDTSLT